MSCEIKACINCGRRFKSCNGVSICGECKQDQSQLVYPMQDFSRLIDFESDPDEFDGDD